MIPNPNIYRSANLLVKHHGEDAPIHAAMWLQELETQIFSKVPYNFRQLTTNSKGRDHVQLRTCPI
jgi:hypothetical protein